MRRLLLLLLSTILFSSLVLLQVSCSSGGGGGTEDVTEEPPKDPPQDEGPVSGDTSAPYIVSIEPVNAASVRFTFNEKISAESARIKSNFSISSDSVSHAVSVVDVKDKSVTITVSPLFSGGVNYTGLAQNIEDIAGNKMSAQSKNFTGIGSVASNPGNFNYPGLDPEGDDDGDGILNGDEIAMGTDPKNPDTDGDDVPDSLDPQPTGTEITLVLSGAPAGFTNSVSATINVGGVNVQKYRYALNSDVFGEEFDSSEPIELNSLPDGEHLVKVIGINQLGDQQNVTDAVSVSWIVDTIAPVAELRNVPATVTSSNEIEIGVRGTDGDTITAYRYVLNDHVSDDKLAEQYIKWTGLNDGAHTLKVVACDNAGNWQSEDDATVLTWRVDTTSPIAAVSGIFDSVTTRNRDEMAVISDVVNYRYRIDGSSWSASTEKSEPIELTMLSEGSHVLEVIGQNEAGTWQSESEPTIVSWTVDLTPPVVRFAVVPPSITNSNTPVIKIEAVDGVTDLASFQYRINGGDLSTFIDALNSIPFSEPLGEGSYTVSVIARDSAGNIQSESDAITTAFTVDTTPPVASFASVEQLPKSITNSQNEQITVSSDDIVQYRYKIDGNDWSDFSDTSIKISLDNLSEGSHQLLIAGVDAAGNIQPEASAVSHDWTVDITPPESVSVTNLPATVTNSGAVNAVVSDDEGDIESYYYRIGGSDWVLANVEQPILAGSLGEGTYTLSVKAVDAAGNIQQSQFDYSWTVDRTAPTALLSGTPMTSVPVNETGIMINVGGTDVVEYRYSLDGSSWSDPLSTDVPISSTGLSETQHTLLVCAMDSAGNWQEQDSATQLVWVIDITPPSSAGLSGLPDPVTNVGNHSISVSGEGIDEYVYSINGAQIGDFANVDVPIELSSLSDGNYTLSVTGYDSAGNAQQSPTEYSFVIDTVAPDAVAVSDSGQFSSTTAIEFSWSSPADAVNARIQIATDELFTNIVRGADTGVELGNVNSYTYAANSSNGSSYYARIAIADAAGNWSTYSGASDGITLVGSITAQIIDNSGVKVQGASITLKAEDGTTVVADTTSDSNGNFVFTNVPVTQTGYSMLVDAAGYNSAQKGNVSVNTGAVSNQGIINLVSSSAASGYVSGRVIDANDGKEIAGAQILVKGWDGSVVDSKVSDANGYFTTSLLLPGTYSIVVTNGSYYELSVDNRSVDGDLVLGDLAICEELAPYQLRVVLLWGQSPRDLDLHLAGPSDISGERFHIYWNKKSFNESNKTYYSGADPAGQFSSASLVQDDTSSYGPEAINIFNGYKFGVFTYTVHNWSQRDWYASNIVMRVYDSQGLYQEIPFPTGASNQWFWKAFQILINGENRSDKTIWIENTFANLSYTSLSSMDWQASGGGLFGFIIRFADGNRTVVLILLGAFLAIFGLLVQHNRMRSAKSGKTE
ncbi:MAG: carboxypeptidase regulatory-like domain-containing protein [Spirochaetes bacterium]|nr:carboxypeptidase regulatory-like domain-containing protein [Spirochaetota bacterium]MBN2772036.1 carboxypeptidase regulatory-like domain-containing protein [Spirochaetota bacterium]